MTYILTIYIYEGNTTTSSYTKTAEIESGTEVVLDFTGVISTYRPDGWNTLNAYAIHPSAGAYKMHSSFNMTEDTWIAIFYTVPSSEDKNIVLTSAIYIDDTYNESIQEKYAKGTTLSYLNIAISKNPDIKKYCLDKIESFKYNEITDSFELSSDKTVKLYYKTVLGTGSGQTYESSTPGGSATAIIFY